MVSVKQVFDIMNQLNHPPDNEFIYEVLKPLLGGFTNDHNSKVSIDSLVGKLPHVYLRPQHLYNTHAAPLRLV